LPQAAGRDAGRTPAEGIFAGRRPPVIDGAEPFCQLVTTGRRSGAPRTVELWFGLEGGSLYFLAGGGQRAGWVRNLLADPAVAVRVGSTEVRGRARLVSDPAEEAMARRLLAAKYQGWGEGRPLSGWARQALPVAVDVEAQ
jgi:deazaflavin-dependent oxidoreductase (nitroreductase family)